MASHGEQSCVLVVSSIVPGEWRSNVAKVIDELEGHLKTIQDQSSHFHEACAALGMSIGPGRANYVGSGVARELQELSGQLLGVAVSIDEDDQCVVRAFGRVKRGVPPSRSGSEVKDCTIIEESLAVCRRLKEMGHEKPRVFCTSNTNDYCDRKRQLHENLAIEFGDVGLIFTSKLPWAVHELTRSFENNVGDPDAMADPV